MSLKTKSTSLKYTIKVTERGRKYISKRPLVQPPFYIPDRWLSTTTRMSHQHHHPKHVIGLTPTMSSRTIRRPVVVILLFLSLLEDCTQPHNPSQPHEAHMIWTILAQILPWVKSTGTNWPEVLQANVCQK